MSGNEYFLRSNEEMGVLFAELPEALETQLEIADRCSIDIDLDKEFGTPLELEMVEEVVVEPEKEEPDAL
jgi:DNA polymerase III alpha subunit